MRTGLHFNSVMLYLHQIVIIYFFILYSTLNSVAKPSAFSIYTTLIGPTFNIKSITPAFCFPFLFSIFGF